MDGSGKKTRVQMSYVNQVQMGNDITIHIYVRKDSGNDTTIRVYVWKEEHRVKGYRRYGIYGNDDRGKKCGHRGVSFR